MCAPITWIVVGVPGNSKACACAAAHSWQTTVMARNFGEVSLYNYYKASLNSSLLETVNSHRKCERREIGKRKRGRQGF